MAEPKAMTGESRVKLSGGSSNLTIYSAVAAALRAVHAGGGTLVDAGCGSGGLWAVLGSNFARYVSMDLIKYPGFPVDGELVISNMDEDPPASLHECGDVVVSLETIEHLENPRSFMRKLVCLTKPGGLVIVTTPNQLSLACRITLLLKNQFREFQEWPGQYPAHMTALLEIDLLRIANECGLSHRTIRYTNCGRIPFTGLNWPGSLGGRAFSDNVLLMGRRIRAQT